VAVVEYVEVQSNQRLQGRRTVQLQTILNSIQKFKGFKYRRVKLERDAEGKRLLVQIEPDKRCKGRCSKCETPGSTYDTLPARRYQFPLWGIPVFLLYAARRIACQPCGKPVVEAIPWALGKSPITRAFAWFLAAWAKRMSWQEVADAFKVSWDTVFGAVSMAVTYGLAHRKLEGIETIGVDEVSWQHGRFLTAVYQLDESCRRLLWLGEERKERTLNGFFDILGAAASKLRAVASDMWTPFMNVIRDRAPGALHVLDRFHIIANVHKAVDKVRAAEARTLAKEGRPVLKNSRWLLLKSKGKLSDTQGDRLAELVKINLKTVRAYLLKEDLRQFWDHFSWVRASIFLSGWCRRTIASRLPDMARVARTFQAHHHLILNWFRAGGAISSGAVEGLNNKLKIVLRRSYGFRSYDSVTTALYHAMGKLPEPKFSHQFW
jgi:transposase